MDKFDYAIFNRISLSRETLNINRSILAALMMVFAIASSMAQGFFDDKKLTKPVPHVSAYNNDRWRLESIERSKSLTLIKLRFHTGYVTQGGYANMDANTTLTDEATGKKYPLISSEGLPKEPDKYIWKESGNDINIPVTLVFGPIPEDVQTITLDDFGLSEIEIGRVPVAQKGADTKFFANTSNPSGELILDAINDDGDVVILMFSYKPKNESVTVWDGGDSYLKDRSSGKTYHAIGCIGLPKKPEKLTVHYNRYFESDNKPIGFCYIFPSMKSNGVTVFDFTDGSWSIENITL